MLGLFVGCIILLTSCERQSAPYELRIEPSSIEFGVISIPRDSIVTQSFNIRNVGDSAVCIMRTDVSCDCMHVAGRLGEIKPGSVEKYALSIDLRKLRGGSFSKNIYIRSNTYDEVDIVHVYGKF